MSSIMKRRIVAGLLLLALGGPLTSALTTADGGPSCSMCSKTCCCAPKAAPERCSLSRPCGRDAEPLTSAVRLLETNALVPAAEELLPPDGSGPASAPAAVPVLDPTHTPTVPPPRASL
jgi:hypothetical protein